MADSKNKFIEIKGANVHNLKNIDLKIPRNKFIVITGVSGSGKSSLAFDTLFAEGQRRYVESLSSYARQFLGKLDKPKVEYIKGISPAIAIEQKVISRNSRSTVGTSTEIYDYLKLLFARIGKTYSPISGKEVKKHSISDVVDFITEQEIDSKCLILAPIFLKENEFIEDRLRVLQQQGFIRILVDGKHTKIEDFVLNITDPIPEILLVLDRISISKELDSSRIADSVQSAFLEGKGYCLIEIIGNEGEIKRRDFSNKFELDGMEFETPDVNFFSFNNPIGACKKCEGYGSVIGIDPELVIPNPSLSVYEEAIQCWRGEKMSEWKDNLIRTAHLFDFPIHRPIDKLSSDEKLLLWTGNKHFEGLNAFFTFLEVNTYKIQYRVMLSRFRGKTECPDCIGTRLRKDAHYVKIGGKSIQELMVNSIEDNEVYFKNLELNAFDLKVGERILKEIVSRLNFLTNVGLGYLTLNRLSNSLSGGESQRINLATSLGSSLVGSLYILDEPSIGLHSKDTEKLIEVLKNLNKIGNTVLVVEHDEDVMRAADQILDMGPYAGTLGGNLVFQGTHAELIQADKSLTAKYLTNKLRIEIPKTRRTSPNKIYVEGAREHNLKNINVNFPLNTLTVIAGVSGSGKSTLVKKIIYPGIAKLLGLSSSESIGKYTKIHGEIAQLRNIEYIDQNPIGKSTRSNPATYLKAFDDIRALYAEQKLAKDSGFKASHFSFNIPGGRCEECEGEGIVTIEMQFIADVQLSCESCNGQRFQKEILAVEYYGYSIFQLLELTVVEALELFEKDSRNKLAKKIIAKILPLQEVGLGYISLGQSSSTLSGGEAQRIKLASYLVKGINTQTTLFIFDEPTTGLHFEDIQKLLIAFNKLIEIGHSLIIIEHNLDIIKNADWLIELGPTGGYTGGNLIFQGKPEELLKVKESPTRKYLEEKLLIR